MTIITRWTTDAVEQMPRVEGERYEIIDGELHVTTQPHANHQVTCDNILFELNTWSRQHQAGRAISAPGLIFSPEHAVAPDLVWISQTRLSQVIDPDGKLHAAPDLVIEVLSPGKANEERDREKKLDLYSRYDVPEYWIVNWRAKTVEVYRRTNDELTPAETLTAGAELTSPLLPGFACPINRSFEL